MRRGALGGAPASRSQLPVALMRPSGLAISSFCSCQVRALPGPAVRTLRACNSSRPSRSLPSSNSSAMTSSAGTSVGVLAEVSSSPVSCSLCVSGIDRRVRRARTMPGRSPRAGTPGELAVDLVGHHVYLPRPVATARGAGHHVGQRLAGHHELAHLDGDARRHEAVEAAGARRGGRRGRRGRARWIERVEERPPAIDVEPLQVDHHLDADLGQRQRVASARVADADGATLDTRIAGGIEGAFETRIGDVADGDPQAVVVGIGVGDLDRQRHRLGGRLAQRCGRIDRPAGEVGIDAHVRTPVAHVDRDRIACRALGAVEQALQRCRGNRPPHAGRRGGAGGIDRDRAVVARGDVQASRAAECLGRRAGEAQRFLGELEASREPVQRWGLAAQVEVVAVEHDAARDLERARRLARQRNVEPQVAAHGAHTAGAGEDVAELLVDRAGRQIANDVAERTLDVALDAQPGVAAAELRDARRDVAQPYAEDARAARRDLHAVALEQQSRHRSR